jgi:hypothetical protein
MSNPQAQALLEAALSDLKDEQKRRALEKASQRPTTRDELWEWIRDVLGYKIPRTVTAPGHRPLFEFIADAYFGDISKGLIRACRGGGKTLGFSIIYLLNTVFKSDFEIVHVGGTEQQSQKGYAYYAGDPKKEGEAGFIRRPAFNDNLAGEPMVSKTALKNGSRLEIRTGGSKKSVSGPHPNLLGIDELDHIDLDTLNIALQMPISRGPYSSTILMGSSQYEYYGTLQTLVESADERGIEVYEYDLLDIIEPCGRSYPKECEGCPFYIWTNPFTQKEEELCRGRGARSRGYYPYSDAVDKFLVSTDVELFVLQMFMMRGTSEGLVYSQFSTDTHVKEFPPEGADISAWKFFGGVDLRTKGRVVIIAEAPKVLKNGRRLRWVVDEWADNNSTPSRIREAAFEMRRDIEKRFGKMVDVYWMEAAAGDEAEDWRRIGLNGKIVSKDKRSIMYGVGQIRDAFLDAQGITSLFVDPRCKKLIYALDKGYQCKRKPDGGFDRDRPEKRFDNSPDALRYAFIGGSQEASRLPDHMSQMPYRSRYERYQRNKWNPML